MASRRTVQVLTSKTASSIRLCTARRCRTCVLPEHTRGLHSTGRLFATSALSGRRTRSRLQPLQQTSTFLLPSSIARGARSIFIQTSPTPNDNAVKFLPNQAVLPAGLPVSYLEYDNHRSTVTPPYLSSLAGDLLSIDGVVSVFYAADFITITKDEETKWAHIKPEVFSRITEAVTAGAPFVTIAEHRSADGQAAPVEQDSLAYNPEDSEVVGMIKELLETRIRPSIQADGGDLEFRGFEGGQVLLKLKGACKSCDSSSLTLKQGIQSMLTHYIEEVEGVTQVQDIEEEISAQEFAKFEEKLKLQRGAAAASSSAA